MIRRGEGGWDGLGGPLWSPVLGVYLLVGYRINSQGRVSIKPTLPPHSAIAPTNPDALFLRLMPIGRP